MIIKSKYHEFYSKIKQTMMNFFFEEKEITDPLYEEATYIIRDHGSYSIVALMRSLHIGHTRGIRLLSNLSQDRILEMREKDFADLMTNKRLSGVFHILASILLFLAGLTVFGSYLIEYLYHYLKYGVGLYHIQSSGILIWIRALPLCIAGISYGKRKRMLFIGSLSFLFGMYICNVTDRILCFHDVSYLAEIIVVIALVFGIEFEIKNLDFYIGLVSGETFSILLVIVRSLFDEYLVDSITRFVFCLYKVPFVLFLIFLALEQKHRINCANIKKGY